MGAEDGSSTKRPAWLPEGWTMKVNQRKDGRIDKYYISPGNAVTCRSRPEVMRFLNVKKDNGPPLETSVFPEEDTNSWSRPEVMHLNVQKDDGPLLVTTASSEEDKNCDIDQGKDSATGLPSGWILEIKTHKSGASAGKNYKSYFNPLTGSRFYTKQEVFRYLKTGECSKSTLNGEMLNDAEPKKKHLCSSTSNQKSFNTDSKEHISSLIETSPDGLPSGWIKEIKYTKNASGVRKDPYYTDPVSGYVFRSKKDALRYIETGEISKYAFKPKTKRSSSMMHAIENESPYPISAKELKGKGGQGTTIRRRLFAGKVSKLKRKTTDESGEMLAKSSRSQPSDQSGLRCELGDGPRYEDLSSSVCLKHKQVKAINQTLNRTVDQHENGLPDKLLEPAEEKALDQVIENLLDSVSKRLPKSSDGKLSHFVTEDLQNLSNVQWLEAEGKETLKPAQRKSVGLAGSAGNITMEWPNKERQERGDNTKVKLAGRKSSRNLRKNPPTEEMTTVGMVANATWVEPENGKPSETGGNFTEANLLEPNELPKQVRGKTSGQGIKESEKEGASSAIESIQRRQSKAKSGKSVPVARRASKRLAGLEADPSADIEVSDRSLKRAKPSTQSKASSAKMFLEDNCEAEAKQPKLQDEHLGEQFILEEQGGEGGTTGQDPECPLASPFGDSWPDPCIEFAFKTLTGQIPVLDTTSIQGILDEQLPSVQAPTTPDPPHTSVAACSNGQDKTGIQMQVNSTGKDHPLEGASAPTGGRVKRLCRRSISRKTPTCDE